MLWLCCKHFTAGATLDVSGNLIYPVAPILRGWAGKHFNAVILFYKNKQQFIKFEIL